MPRHARVVAADYPMHVILRGIDRAAIFFADTDRYLFLATLAELALAESVGVHACVLMTNHAHLLMTPGAESAVSRLMRAWPEGRPTRQPYLSAQRTALRGALPLGAG